MSWTATLTALEPKFNEWRFTILYTDTDTGDTFEKHYRQANITQRKLRSIARNEAALLASNPTTDIDIPIGTTIDVTPDVVTPPDPPTQAELDEAAWFVDYRQLKQMLQVTEAVPALLTAQAITSIANLRSTLDAGWLNSYLDRI